MEKKPQRTLTFKCQAAASHGLRVGLTCGQGGGTSALSLISILHFVFSRPALHRGSSQDPRQGIKEKELQPPHSGGTQVLLGTGHLVTRSSVISIRTHVTHPPQRSVTCHSTMTCSWYSY